jgi:transcriptional regulator with PAS, ATPase and Fis domain
VRYFSSAVSSPSQLDHIIDVLIGNPFEVDDSARADAAELADSLDVADDLRSLTQQGSGGIERAKLLILAVGHAQACRHPSTPDAVLGPETLPPDAARRLPRSMGDYRSVCMAAGRGYRALSRILGNSSSMRAVRRATWSACFGSSLRHTLDLERVIRDHDVLVFGETGTGKELFAHAIQIGTPGPSDGSPAPGNAINAAAIPDTLVESELFGHVKGAFTGATDARAGRLRSADGGCFFLDEIGDLPFTTQVKLLRVMETNEVYPVGSDTPYSVEVRYVAATHKDLEELVEAQEFRRDLFQRIAGSVIRVPPLRERPEDIVEIGLAFVQAYLPDSVHDDHLEAIDRWLRSSAARSYSWPGNVRELQNALRDLLLGLEPELSGDSSTARARPGGDDSDLPETIRECEAPLQEVSDWYLQRVLEHVGGNYTQAARILGVDRSTVRRRAPR